MCVASAAAWRDQSSMAPRVQYRSLAKQYAVLAQHTANPLLADGYRKLAEGYLVLAEVGEAADAAGSGVTATGDADPAAARKQDA